MLPLLIGIGILAWIWSNASVPAPGAPLPNGPNTAPTNGGRAGMVFEPGVQIPTAPAGGIAVVSNNLELAPSDVVAIMQAIATVDSSATSTTSINPYQLDVYGHRTDPVLDGSYVISALRGGSVRGLSVNGIAVDT